MRIYSLFYRFWLEKNRVDCKFKTTSTRRHERWMQKYFRLDSGKIRLSQITIVTKDGRAKLRIGESNRMTRKPVPRSTIITMIKKGRVTEKNKTMEERDKTMRGGENPWKKVPWNPASCGLIALYFRHAICFSVFAWLFANVYIHPRKTLAPFFFSVTRIILAIHEQSRAICGIV